MRYIIRSCFVENTYEEPIDQQRFELIKHSRKVLTSALSIEEIFDNLISNYIDVETKCLAIAVQTLVRRTRNYQDVYERLAEINLAFTNYLSTGRAYVDKISSTASKCFTDSEVNRIRDTIDTELSSQYDKSFDYRFMEALRNHVQHSGKALNLLRPGSPQIQRINYQSDKPRELFIEPICSKTHLIEQGGFKSTVLNECPEYVNLLGCIRNHLLGLSRVHRSVRSHTETAVSMAKLQIKEAQALLENKVKGNLDRTEAVMFITENEMKETIPMLLDWDEVRVSLVARNEGIPEGVSRYPSGNTHTQ